MQSMQPRRADLFDSLHHGMLSTDLRQVSDRTQVVCGLTCIETHKPDWGVERSLRGWGEARDILELIRQPQTPMRLHLLLRALPVIFLCHSLEKAPQRRSPLRYLSWCCWVSLWVVRHFLASSRPVHIILSPPSSPVHHRLERPPKIA